MNSADNQGIRVSVATRHPPSDLYICSLWGCQMGFVETLINVCKSETCLCVLQLHMELIRI